MPGGAVFVCPGGTSGARLLRRSIPGEEVLVSPGGVAPVETGFTGGVRPALVSAGARPVAGESVDPVREDVGLGPDEVVSDGASVVADGAGGGAGINAEGRVGAPKSAAVRRIP
ncbi:hypothetical protein AMK34_24650 [Amycolatopsis sp. CB00013]|nr:hypothetical protein AMK34_24650 [Amycolatopsis sp. CB00013]